MKGCVMTVRKNFNFNEETAKYLEEKAKQEKKTQTQYLEELIEKDLREEKIARRLAALEKLKKTPPANIGDIDLKKVHIDSAVRRAK